MLSPVRRPLVIETWSPREIATFEGAPPPSAPPSLVGASESGRATAGALALHGKCFHTVQRFVKTKTTKEIIEFYYIWSAPPSEAPRSPPLRPPHPRRKMSSHYTEWKQNFVRRFRAARAAPRAPPDARRRLAGTRRARPRILK